MCYVRSSTEVADRLVFVFNVMQPPQAIKPCNTEASEDKLRLSKLTLGEGKGPRLVCRNLSPKGASLGWEFGSSCSVGLWLSWGSIFVSSCCLVVGVCSVVAVCISLVSQTPLRSLVDVRRT